MMFKVKFLADDPSRMPKLAEVGDFKDGKAYPVVYIDANNMMQPQFFVVDEGRVIRQISYDQMREFARYVEARTGKPESREGEKSKTGESLLGG